MADQVEGEGERSGGGESSISDGSFITDVRENRNGLQAYQFEPRRQHDDIDGSSSSGESESDEVGSSEEEEVSRIARLDWCQCDHCSTEHLGRDKECLCCQDKPATRAVTAPSNTDNHMCLINNGDFRLLCLTPVVLRNVLVGLNNIREDHWVVNPPNNSGLRYAAYRQLTWWVHGTLGPGRRRTIPACATHAIRQAFPTAPEEQYTGYHSGEDESEED